MAWPVIPTFRRQKQRDPRQVSWTGSCQVQWQTLSQKARLGNHWRRSWFQSLPPTTTTHTSTCTLKKILEFSHMHNHTRIQEKHLGIAILCKTVYLWGEATFMNCGYDITLLWSSLSDPRVVVLILTYISIAALSELLYFSMLQFHRLSVQTRGLPGELLWGFKKVMVITYLQ